MVSEQTRNRPINKSEKTISQHEELISRVGAELISNRKKGRPDIHNYFVLIITSIKWILFQCNLSL